MFTQTVRNFAIFSIGIADSAIIENQVDCQTVCGTLIHQDQKLEYNNLCIASIVDTHSVYKQLRRKFDYKL